MVKGHYLSVFSEENRKETENDPWSFQLKATEHFRIDKKIYNEKKLDDRLAA